jgi:ubiquinone/menaquinone biosynthesis C-methylase UbiE
MEHFDRRQHWEKIYQTKQTEEASWYQPLPETSLHFFEKHGISPTSKIIDVGGGDSLLVDHLLDRGHQDITLLDISAHALDKAKKRLGNRSSQVKWVVADASDFQPGELYDCWHDRAAFHFLTQAQEVEKYVQTAAAGIRPGGLLVLGTFSVNGPMKCSGLDIRQYSETEMTELFAGHFEKTGCLYVDHKTPSGVLQNFIFCGFMKC